MPTINVTVASKIATLQSDSSYAVCNNSDYTIAFTFDSEWDSYTEKTARFSYGRKYTDVVFNGTSCALPVISNATQVAIGVYAGSLHTTTPAVLKMIPSILSASGTPTDPTASVYEQIMEELNSKVTEPDEDGTSGQVLTTDGAGGRSWSTVSGGTSDHATLTHLAYADSGHTGFQATISDLATIRSGAALGATAIQSHQDISGKQDVSNLVTSVSSSSTDTQYPSAKCVYDGLATKGSASDVGLLRDDVNGILSMMQRDYSDISEVASIVRANTVATNKKLFPVGDQIVMPWKDMDDTNHNSDATAYQVAWDIVHHGNVTLQNGNIVPGMFLQMHLCSAYGVQFGRQQAFYQAEEAALAAGTYSVGFGVKYNDTFPSGSAGKFTLTQALPIGGRLVLNSNKVEAWASATAANYTESVDFTSIDSTSGTTYLGMISSNNAKSSDGLNAMYRILYGHNRWSTSALRQYLNASGDNWFESKEDFDIRPDQYAKKGFMTGFSQDFLDAIKPVKVTTALNTVEGFENTTEDTYDTFFLPSLEQMNVTPQLSTVEGPYFEYWRERLGLSGFAQTYPTVYDAFKIPALNSTSPQYVRLRSAYRGSACYTWFVYSSGYVNYGFSAYGAYRFSPVCVIC